MNEHAALTELATALGLTEADLDETVHDLAGQSAATAYNHGEGEDGDPFDDLHTRAEADASDVNNAGLAAQVAFIAGRLGPDLTRALLHDLAG
jgi:hypothetical protein